MSTVYIEEEYGYRYWMWDIDMSAQELITWWKELDTVSIFDFMNPVEDLPFGSAKQLSMDDFFKHSNPTGFGIFIREPDESNEKTNYMHLHTDGDSSIKIDGVEYFHKGYDPEFFMKGKEYESNQTR